MTWYDMMIFTKIFLVNHQITSRNSSSGFRGDGSCRNALQVLDTGVSVSQNKSLL